MSVEVVMTRTEHSAAVLHGIAASTGYGAQVRQLLATAMILEGASRANAERQVGIDRQTLRDCVQ